MRSVSKHVVRTASLPVAIAVLLGLGLSLALAQGAWAAQSQENEFRLYKAQGFSGLGLTAQATKDIAGPDIFIDYIGPQSYTGFPIEPAISVTDFDSSKSLVEGIDYSVSFRNNVNAGKATATITGMGSYSGSTTTTFTIDGAYLWEAAADPVPSATYTGKAITPKPVLRLGGYVLEEGRDYVLSYSGNVDAGSATINATAVGSNFLSSKSVSFTIDPAPISKATLRVSNQYYAGRELTPDLSTAVYNGKKLEEFSDYGVAFRNNEDVGTASAIVTGRGNFTGTKTLKFKIVKQPIAKATVTKVPDATYTGRNITYTVLVKVAGHYLTEGPDYKITYKNNKNAGKATIVIKGKGGYKGTKKSTFTIKKAENRLHVLDSYDLVSALKVKKAAQTLPGIAVSGAKGKVTFVKKSGSSKLGLNKKTGAIKVAKGTKAGTYSMRVLVKASGGKNYKPASEVVTAEVRVI